MNAARLRTAIRLAIPPLALALVFATRPAWLPWLERVTPSVMLMPVVILAAWLGGARAALSTWILSLAGILIVDPTPWRLATPEGWEQRVRIGHFVLEGVLVIILVGALERSRVKADRAAQTLATLERKYRRLIETASEGIWILDARARTEYVNPGMAEMLGYRPEQMIGRPASDFLDDDEREAGARLLRRRGELSRDHLELRYRHRDGTPVWGLVSLSPIYDDDGGFTGTLITITDVTRRRLAEAARRRSEEQLRFTLESARVGYWEWDLTTGAIRWSDNLEPLHGFEPGTFGGTFEAFLACVHPDDRDPLVRAIEVACRDGGEYQREFRVVWADGSVHWMMGQGRAFLSPDGRPTHMVGIGMDITARKRVEESMQFLAEASAALAASLDYESTLANVARLAVPRIADRCYIDMVEPDGTLRRLALASRDGPGPESGTASAGGIPHPGAGEPPIRADEQGSTLCVSLRSRGRTLGIIGLVAEAAGRRFGADDLTLAETLAARAAVAIENARLYRQLRDANLAAERASKSKDQFLAVLSHELRTPLTPVLASVTEMLDDPETAPELRPVLDLTRRNIELEARLIDDLLDITRIAQGKLALKSERTNVHVLIHHACEMCTSAPAPGPRLVCSLDADDPYVLADPARLQQVFWNLIKNALKFTPPGGLVEIRTWNEPARADGDGSRRLMIAVRDEGIGIEPAHLPRIFDAFDQGDVSVTRKFGGLGLGLTISRWVVEQLGGTLRAESPGRDRGATFTIELAVQPIPLDSAAEPKPRPWHRPSTDGPRGLRILLVDDDRDTLQALTRLLRRHGHTVSSCADVASALEAARAEETPLDLVVTDIGLPDGTGHDLLRALRTLRPGLPGLALSGYGMDSDVRQSEAAGFSAHLTKPVDFRRLERAIRAIADGAAGVAPEPS